MSDKNLYDESMPILGGCDPSDCASCGSKCGGSAAQNSFPSTISLTLDDDTEVTCSILTVFSVKEQEYIALLPLANESRSGKMDLNASFDEEGNPTDAFVASDEMGEATGEVWLFKFARSMDGAPMLDNIEDDDEYMRAGAMFEQIMEDARAQEMSGTPM